MSVFSSGLETANLMVSSGLLQQTWSANWQLYENSDPNERLRFQVYPHQNYNILAFVTSTLTLKSDEADLACSSTFKDMLPVFEFLCSKNNPTFAINKATICLFASYHDKLLALKNQLCQGDRKILLIITGHSLGGSIAALFTLWMLNSMDLRKTKHPLCITFGSPLIGDRNLQRTMLECQKWSSNFIHVVSNHDPVPRIFIHHKPVHQKGVYIPFGTFLFCSESGSACFEDSDSNVELLAATASYGSHTQIPDQRLPLVDYGPVLENIYSRTLCKDATELVAGWADQPFEAGIIRQLRAIGVAQLQNIDITKLVKREKRVFAKKKLITLPKKLNDVKINMCHLEWYKKGCKDMNKGYYDSYKEKLSEMDVSVDGIKRALTSFWKDVVEEVENKLQKEGDELRTMILFGGTSYRRMVEPLDIAEYYKEQKLDYEIRGRSEHYIRLEEWLKEEKYDGQKEWRKHYVSSILTKDSCFWAKVEEAIIMLNSLKTQKPGAEDKVKKLEDFENYVWSLLTNYEVSSEIFLAESCFMKWWSDWKAYKKTSGNSLTSFLQDFMETGAYKIYESGEWCPPS